jgi:hypothetical protein
MAAGEDQPKLVVVVVVDVALARLGGTEVHQRCPLPFLSGPPRLVGRVAARVRQSSPHLSTGRTSTAPCQAAGICAATT